MLHVWVTRYRKEDKAGPDFFIQLPSNKNISSLIHPFLFINLHLCVISFTSHLYSVEFHPIIDCDCHCAVSSCKVHCHPSGCPLRSQSPSAADNRLICGMTHMASSPEGLLRTQLFIKALRAAWCADTSARYLHLEITETTRLLYQLPPLRLHWAVDSWAAKTFVAVMNRDHKNWLLCGQQVSGAKNAFRIS